MSAALVPCLLATLIAGVDVQVTARDLDEAAIETGVDVRLGSLTDGWTVEVQPGATATDVHLRLRSPLGRVIERDVELDASDRDGRSRELGSMLALILEQTTAEPDAPPEDPPPEDPPPEDPPQPPPPPPPPVTGWIGALGRVGLNPGSPVSPDPGVGLAAGLWIDRAYLQPVAQFAWSRTPGTPTLDGIRFGAGLLAGAPFGAGRWWAGGGVIGQAMWASARAEAKASGWTGVPEILGTVQARGGWWTAGVRAGLDLVLPPLRAFGNDASVRWNPVRLAFGLTIGVRIPPRAGARNRS